MIIKLADEQDIEKVNNTFKNIIFPYTGEGNLHFNLNDYEFSIVAYKENSVVGFCYTDKETETSRTRKTAYIGYFVMPLHQNKDVGYEIVNTMIRELQRRGFLRVECDIVDENVASIKLAESLGLKHEGTLKNRFLTDDNRLLDDLWFGMSLSKRDGGF